MSKRVVVDSSVIVKWLNSQGEKDIDKADELLRNCEKEKLELIAPELAKYEVGNAILYKGMDVPKTKASLNTLFLLPITFIKQSVEELKEVVEIAYRDKITFYDASFIGLARKKRAVLISANPKHQKSFEGVKVINLRDY